MRGDGAAGRRETGAVGAAERLFFFLCTPFERRPSRTGGCHEIMARAISAMSERSGSRCGGQCAGEAAISPRLAARPRGRSTLLFGTRHACDQRRTFSKLPYDRSRILRP